MQSLKAKFNGNCQEVLDFIGTYGVFAGMTKYQVKDYAAMRNWLKEVTGDENFGISPKFDTYPGETAFDKLAKALCKTIWEVMADNERLQKENKAIWQVIKERGKADEEKARLALEMVMTL